MLKRIVLLVAALASIPASSRAQAPTGEWVALSTSGAQVDSAINQATSQFNFIKRAIARKRLRATNPVPRTLSIRLYGDSIEVTLNGTLRVRNLPGHTTMWKFNGEPTDVTTTLDGSVLTNTFRTDDGQKRNRYLLRQDGRLQLDVEVSSPQLPHPVSYTQLFERR